MLRPSTGGSVADLIKKGHAVTAISTGRPFPSFPTLTKMTRGFQGIAAIVAATGVGKSLLAQHLAADLACEDFPGVYCDFENPEADTLRRFTLLHGPDHPGLASLWRCHSYELGVERLRRHQAGFLVLDTLTSSVGVAGEELSAWSAAIARRMSELNELAQEGYSVLVVVQSGRGTYDSNRCPSLRSAMHSSSVEQLAWTVLGAWRNRAGERFVRPTKNRFPVDAMYQNASLRLVADDQERITEGMLVLGGERRAPAVKPTVVVKLLAKRGPLTFGDLRDDLQRVTRKSPRTAERMIGAERKAGRIVVGDDGLYQLPGAA